MSSKQVCKICQYLGNINILFEIFNNIKKKDFISCNYQNHMSSKKTYF